MTDVAQVLGISQKRANELNDKCFDTIAVLQDKGECGQIAKTLETLSTVGDTEMEVFYLGFVYGRIVQTNEVAQEGAEKFVEHHWRELSKAKGKLSEHPEFG